MLSFMGISGVFGKINLSKIDLDVKIPDEIYAEIPFPIVIELKNNKGFFPTLLAKVKIFNKDGVFLFVDKKSKDSIIVELKFDKRGVYTLDRITICSVFPFNFFTRCRNLKRDLKVIVFPKPRPCSYFVNQDSKRDKKGENFSKKTGYENELISIRNYRTGDPLKYISWKATAKTGKLKTKELSSSSFKPIVIDFKDIPFKNLEEKLSCITFLILDLYKKGVPFGLRIGKTIYKPELSKKHKIKLLKELAVYGLEA